MIYSLHGTVTQILEQALVLEVAGVGFLVATATPHQYVVQQTASVHTLLVWHQETGPQLYGFSTTLERTLFSLITACSGFGPKIALALLAHFAPVDLISALAAGDTKALSAVSGVGAKKAETLIVYLKEKVLKLVDSPEAHTVAAVAHLKELTQALTALGYTRQEQGFIMQELRKQLGSTVAVSFNELLRKALSIASQQK